MLTIQDWNNQGCLVCYRSRFNIFAVANVLLTLSNMEEKEELPLCAADDPSLLFGQLLLS